MCVHVCVYVHVCNMCVRVCVYVCMCRCGRYMYVCARTSSMYNEYDYDSLTHITLEKRQA